MCGIVAVLRRSSGRMPPDGAHLLDELERAVGALGDARTVGSDVLARAAAHVEEVDTLLKGAPGVQALLADRALAVGVEHRVEQLQAAADRVEAALDASGASPPTDLSTAELEDVNAALVRLKDAVWAVGHDRLRTARAVADLSGSDLSRAAIEAFTSLQVALSALDRLEVRGRDSAGLHVFVHHHTLDLDDPAVARLLDERRDPLFGSRAVRGAGDALSFVYKAAAEIGELGDNTALLRAAVRADDLLHLAVSADTAQAVVLAHTRWASVGIISEANAHPVNSEELDRPDGPYVVGALNGDVDNYADLAAIERLDVPTEMTTDAKVIPSLVSRRLGAGEDLDEAFRATVASLEGSVAIAAGAADRPGRILLALRGSGQALNVGMAEDAFVVASEPYGLVEETATYLRMDGETPADPQRRGATRGQIVTLDAEQAGELAGIRRFAYDGTELPVSAADLQHAEITTRDIDRGASPHYLLKEISEAPASFRKTLRGRIAAAAGDRLTVELGPESLPDAVRGRLRDGTLRRVVVIGQGTAAVAGQSFSAALRNATPSLLVEAMPATELSGFALRPDMHDTLVVAISQSGTTTDTNRTVDLVRARGASVVAIVNRRNSDLVEKSEGVLFTSDGRDVEMSVASTKAFYSQIAAGFLLALAIAREAGPTDETRTHELLAALRELPDRMLEVIATRDAIAGVAQRHAPAKRYWAVVGNGANRIAASELRIKLSELCYKSIACDFTEDKKHIDLSSEPLILVCASGLEGSNADDVAKEVGIYHAHRATPIVIATEGDARFSGAVETVMVPAVHPALGFVLSTVAGHLFGYEAALAIDAQAVPLREARAAVEAAVSGGDGDAVLDRLAAGVTAPAAGFFDGLRTGAYDGHLDASSAVRIASVLRFATGATPLDAYQVELGKVGTPSTVVEDLTAALSQGIDELTRPVDAIKHQAKTVTVGISRSDETLLEAPLVREVLAAGVARDSLSYRALRTLVDLDPAVEQVTGFTRYRIEGDVDADAATIHVVDRGGVAAGLPSRTDSDPRLIGTKHRVAYEREVTVAKGRRDGRTLVIVPELKGALATGLTLLHVAFRARLAPDVARGVLQGYRGRYAALKDAVTETEPTFDDTRLADVDVVDLLTEPVYVLAERWRTRA
ncbi:MAG TPA: SIS domain-containing protein [Acidimicrobiia bacterium]|nr:SIS domain-containing protein [Acidimicrobiia bacterium]